ncbi:MAG: IS66 family insertion sequence element accessory protein TnpB [Deltaproteobacteria bacterium]|nr:IS66 family insertion sequence element accessory protein TnpB [Deltaproteobacteria bacterium]
MQSRNPVIEFRGRERVALWRASGLSAARIAAQHTLSVTSLTRWASRLSTPSSSSPAFVPVVRAKAPVSRELVVEVGAARARVAPNFDADLLAAVVRALGGER